MYRIGRAHRAVATRRRRLVRRYLPVLFTGLVVLLTGSVANNARAENLPLPQDPVILKVSGNIRCTNAPDGAQFDRAMLAALEAQTIDTETPWTDGVNRFEGPAIRALLDLVGAKGSQIRVSALNDYAVDIPISDFDTYGAILAMKMNDEILRIRTRGPLWLIYPWDARPELRSDLYYGRAVWHASQIIVLE